MTKEQLEALGLDEEQIKEVFRLNGIAVTNAKGDLSAREQELADTKKLLEDANKEIEGFKDLDVEGIKQAAEDYKTKYEEAERKAQEELETIKFNHELETMARDLKAKNTKAVLALVDKENLYESKNRKEDMQKAFENIAKENEFLFDSENQEGGNSDEGPRFTRPGGGSGPEIKEDLGSAIQDYYKK